MKRLWFLASLLGLTLLVAACGPAVSGPFAANPAQEDASQLPAAKGAASLALAALPIRDPAPMAGYNRAAFLPHGWADTDRNGCDQRNDVLRRDLTDPLPKRGCVVTSGTLHDPYTGHTEPFTKTHATAVQIDHVVALGDAWATGAAAWTPDQREQFATDEAELLAVDGPQNEAKGDRDASQWLPPDPAFQCRYVAKQVAVKTKYKLWTTVLEHAAMAGVLNRCPGQVIPNA